MSTNTLNPSVEFLPHTQGAAGHGFLAAIKAALSALNEGRNAEAEYKRQMARGVSHEAAIKAAFAKSFGNQ